MIASYLHIKQGERIDPQKLEEDLDRLHGREDFERVTFELEQNDEGEIVLKIIAIAKEWGPNYIPASASTSTTTSKVTAPTTSASTTPCAT